jgi:hypothetical protein
MLVQLGLRNDLPQRRRVFSVAESVQYGWLFQDPDADLDHKGQVTQSSSSPMARASNVWVHTTPPRPRTMLSFYLTILLDSVRARLRVGHRHHLIVRHDAH